MGGFPQLKHSDFVNTCERIKKHCDKSLIEEFGAFSKNGIKFFKNLSDYPVLYFKVDPEEYQKYYTNNKIFFVWHSHVIETCRPSPLDYSFSIESELPSLIYSVKNNDFSLFNPLSSKLIYFSVSECSINYDRSDNRR